MQRIISIALAICLGLSLAMDAEAKRFGGGRSFGAAPSHQSRQAASPFSRNQAAPQQAGRPTAQGGASRWLGPLAGLAAGGLLASLFMGGGFHGLQLLDILVLGALAFLIFRFLRSRQRPSSPLAAGSQPQQRSTLEHSPFGQATARPAVAAPIKAPAWFDEQRFIGAAREHFMALQQHWDANEMDRIAEFVTPQLLTFLKAEREEIGEAFQSTYIDDLQVTLDGLDDLADKTVATLTFSGVSKTSRFDQGEAFNESWRMEREQGQNKPWLVAGIRQNA